MSSIYNILNKFNSLLPQQEAKQQVAESAVSKPKSKLEEAIAKVEEKYKGFKEATNKSDATQEDPITEAGDDEYGWDVPEKKTSATSRKVAGTRYGGAAQKDDEDSADEKADGEKKGRGRPKGTGKKMGAKGPTGKSKLMRSESIGASQRSGYKDFCPHCEHETSFSSSGTCMDCGINQSEWPDEDDVNQRTDESDYGWDVPEKKEPTSGSRKVAGTRYGGAAQKDDDSEETSTTPAEKKGRGRPKGTGKKMGAKGPTGKSKLMREGRMLDEAGEALEHILSRFSAEVKQFENNPNTDLDRDLYDALYDYYVDIGEMPYGVQKARTGDPYEWVCQQLEDHLFPDDEQNLDIDLNKNGIDPEGEYTEEVAVEDSLSGELNELAKLAGLTTESVVKECGEMSPFSQTGQTQDDSGMTVNASLDTRTGQKTVSVNATGAAADKLAEILKLSGLASGSAQPEPQGAVVVVGGDEEMEETKEYGSTEVADAPDYSNSPDEQVQGTDAIVHQGNDLNREKKQFASKPRTGDNPMASEAFDPIESLGRKLMKEYESIKIQK